MRSYPPEWRTDFPSISKTNVISYSVYAQAQRRGSFSNGSRSWSWAFTVNRFGSGGIRIAESTLHRVLSLSSVDYIFQEKHFECNVNLHSIASLWALSRKSLTSKGKLFYVLFAELGHTNCTITTGLHADWGTETSNSVLGPITGRIV